MWIALRRENCNFDEVVQDKWGSVETAMGIRDCGCRHTTGMGTGIPLVRYGRKCGRRR